MREHAPGVLLLEQPGVVALADEVGVRDELVLLVEGDADERDEVGEHALAGAAHLRAVELLVRLPELLGRPLVRRAADRLRELLHLAEGEPLRLPAGVEDLERRDLVAVLLAELLPRLDRVAGAVGGVGRVAGLDHLVGGGLVDRLLVHAAQVDDPLAQLGVRRERRDGLVEQRAGGGGDVVDGRARRLPVASRAAASCWSGSSAATIPPAISFSVVPPASCSSSARSSVAEPAVEAGEAGGDRRDRVRVADAERHLLEQLLERHGRLAVERRRCRRARSR